MLQTKTSKVAKNEYITSYFTHMYNEHGRGVYHIITRSVLRIATNLPVACAGNKSFPIIYAHVPLSTSEEDE